ncbi:insulinase family protein [bacterium]|nr:insulinase family protein [bacterium]
MDFNRKTVAFQSNKMETQSCNTVEYPINTAISKISSKSYITTQINKDYKLKQVFSILDSPNQKIYELSNGMKIVTINAPGPTTISTAVNVGSLNDFEGKEGMAHLTEHLIADSTQSNEVKRLGGSCNAGTNYNYTIYYSNYPITNKKDLNEALKYQANIFKEHDFSRIEDEKSIINQEINEKSSDFFNINKLFNETFKNLFNKEYKNASISNPNSVNSISKEDLETFYKKYYNPNNMATVIVGNVDENDINLIAKTFSPLKNYDNPNQNSDIIINPSPDKTVRKDLYENADKTTNECLAFLIPPLNEKEEFTIDVLKEIIESRAKEKNIYPDFSGIRFGQTKPHALCIYNTLRNDKICEEDLQTLYNIIFDLQTKPVNSKELEKFKSKIKNDNSEVMEDNNFLSEIISEIITNNDEPNNSLDKINSITSKDLQEAAKRLDLNKASIVVLHPKKENLTKAKNDISFTGNIEATQNTKNRDIHEFILPNNLKVIIDANENHKRSAIIFELKSQKPLTINPFALSLKYFTPKTKEQNDENYEKGINSGILTNSFGIEGYANGSCDNTLKMINDLSSIIESPKVLNPKEFETKKNIICICNYDRDDLLETKIDYEIYKDIPVIPKTSAWIKALTYEDVLNSKKELDKNAQGSVVITLPKSEYLKNKNEILKILSKFPKVKPNDNLIFFKKFEQKPLSKNKVFTKETDENEITVEKDFKIIDSGNIKDKASLILLIQLLNSCDEDSPIYNDLRTKYKICYTPYAAGDSNHDTGDISKFLMVAETSANTKDGLQTIVNSFNNCIKTLTNTKITEDQLQSIKAKEKCNLMENEAFTEKSNILLANNLSSYYERYFKQELEKAIDNVTVDDIQAIAKYYLTQNSITGITAPKNILEENADFLRTQGEVIS